MHVSFQDELLGFLAQQPLFNGFSGLDIHVLAVILSNGHHGGGDQHNAVFRVDALEVGDGGAGICGFLEHFQYGFLENHDGGALTGLQLGQGGGAGFNHDFVGGQAFQIVLAIVVVLNQGSDSGIGGAAGQRVAHGDQALQGRIRGEILKGLGDGYALCSPLGFHLRIVSQNHVANAYGIPVALRIIGETQQRVGIINGDGLKIAGILQLKGEGGLSNHKHVTAQGAGFHLAVDLGDQRAGATIEEEAAIITGGQVREFGFQGLIHHVDNELIHRGIDDELAFNVLVDGQCGAAHGKHQDQCKSQQFFHGVYLRFLSF